MTQVPTDILKRRIGVYPKTWEQKEHWEREAKKKGMPVSTFLTFVIDQALSDSDGIQENPKIKKELVTMNQEINELKRENRRTLKLLEIQERELEEYRNRAFTDKSFTGIRSFNPDLIEAIRRAGRPIKDEELLKTLSIGLDDSEGIKVVSTQIEALQSYNLVKKDRRGWVWVE